MPATDPPDLPRPRIEEVFVELTSRCNLRCRYCAVSLPEYAGRDMDARHIDAILGFVAVSGPIVVSMNAHGETTAREDWAQISGRFRSTRAQLHLISNFAHYFSNEEIAALARYAGIRISLDCVDRKLLREIRRSVDLRIVLHNLVRLRAVALIREGRIPLLGINCVVSDRNVFVVGDLVSFAAANGFADVTLHDVAELPALPDDRPRHIASLPAERYAESVASIRGAIALGRRLGLKIAVQPSLDEALARGSGAAPRSIPYFMTGSPVRLYNALPRGGETRLCLDPWRVLKFSADGNAASCCVASTVIGHLDKAPIAEIVAGDAAQRLRAEMASGRLNPECRVCPVRPVVPVPVLQTDLAAWKARLN